MMDSTRRDPHGQPINRALNAARLADRAIDELIGLCRGVLGDGAVTESEASLLMDWMAANRAAAELWPANALFPRLREMLVDRVLDPEEQGELLDALRGLTGDSSLPEQAASFSATLPLCSPPPEVTFPDRLFCLTGRFAFGSRRQCEAKVVERGGRLESEPTRQTSFLVIGTMGSSDWIHSTYGRKIESAVELRAEGLPIHIVSEEHWIRALDSGS